MYRWVSIQFFDPFLPHTTNSQNLLSASIILQFLTPNPPLEYGEVHNLSNLFHQGLTWKKITVTPKHSERKYFSLLPDFFEAILSNGNRTALEWDHKNWVHNGIYCLLWKKVRLHFIKMSALWCSILRQMLYIVDKAPIKSHSYFYDYNK